MADIRHEFVNAIPDDPDSEAAGETLPSHWNAAHTVDGLALEAELDAHTSDATNAHAGSAIGFTPAGTISATNVQAAIEEVAAEAGGSTPTLASVLAVGNTADLPIVFSGGGVLDGSGSIYMEADAAENGEKGSLELIGIVARITGGFTSGIGNGARFTAGGASGSQAGTAALTGGNAAGASDDAGGDIKFTPGAGDGAGRNGQVVAVLPTADPSVTNAIWSDGGTLVQSGSTAGGVTPATDPGDIADPLIADPTTATPEEVAIALNTFGVAYNTLLANLRTAGLIA